MREMQIKTIGRLWGFLGGSDNKESAAMQETACNVGDFGSIPGGGNGNLLQYSCLGNPMDRGAWWATVQRVTKSRTQLSMHVACGNQGVLRAWLFFVAVTIRLLNLHVSTPYVHFLISPS